MGRAWSQIKLDHGLYSELLCHWIPVIGWLWLTGRKNILWWSEQGGKTRSFHVNPTIGASGHEDVTESTGPTYGYGPSINHEITPVPLVRLVSRPNPIARKSMHLAPDSPACGCLASQEVASMGSYLWEWSKLVYITLGWNWWRKYMENCWVICLFFYFPSMILLVMAKFFTGLKVGQEYDVSMKDMLKICIVTHIRIK